MKKLIVISLILISSLQTIVGQEKNELDLITSGKWYLEYMEMAGQKKSLPIELKENNWMIFHSDGNHEIMTMGEMNKGKWEYLKDEKTIKMTDKGKVSNQEIIILNDNELILRFKQGEMEILMGLKK
ncbi:hypothetical protein BTO06_12375 [Tenacibaculum sp. SZ-18]|uniref:lipocalin family protein n=1 Tax=Tenacibaculum sp. SZ-18 TaxID=754423 RepID=UPI000C2D0BAE|nr:lipocalin family protein [Tenacibaculum sp. SZ-18]AUC15898.1 hypothetical protein BTO06_12375 [Tenacibaculum sp. SZ-18]